MVRSGVATATVPTAAATGSSSSTDPCTIMSEAALIPAGSRVYYNATHWFAEVTAARANSDGSLSVTLHRATVLCGGPDDLHYDIATASQTGTVTPSGKLQMLTSALQEQAVARAAFGSRLSTDERGRIFEVIGTLSDITALTEMYHP